MCLQAHGEARKPARWGPERRCSSHSAESRGPNEATRDLPSSFAPRRHGQRGCEQGTFPPAFRGPKRQLHWTLCKGTRVLQKRRLRCVRHSLRHLLLRHLLFEQTSMDFTSSATFFQLFKRHAIAVIFRLFERNIGYSIVSGANLISRNLFARVQNVQ